MTETTQPAIVYLDADDEITSAAARLRGIDAERVVFVLPYGSRLATSRINFRLLAREAVSRGKVLEIVAADASARALAGTAGLPVHASVAAFEGRDVGLPGGLDASSALAAAPVGGAAGPSSASTSSAPPVVEAASSAGAATRVLTIPRAGAEPVPIVGRRRTIVRPRTAVVVALIVLLLVGGGGLAAFLYLPSATIVLRPASQAVGPVALSIQARTDLASPDPSSLVVPAREFAFDLSASQTFTTTGTQVIDTNATGSVTFENLDPTSPKPIPAGSVVSTSGGIKFATVSSIRIAKARLHGLTITPSTGSVAVTAVNAGTDGNVAANTIMVIPSGYDPTFLKVNNPQPTTGGTHTATPLVSQQDVDAATATLQQALRDDLAAQIAQASGIPSGTTLLESTGKVGPTTPSVDPTTLVGQAVATFDLGLSATGTVTGVDTAPVEALAAHQLADHVTPGWQLVDGSTSMQIGRPTVEGDTITFPVTAGAREIHAVDQSAILAQIRGLDLPRARTVLEAYGQVDISLWPAWVTTIPNDANRISLTIDTGTNPGGSASPAGASPNPTGGGSTPTGTISTPRPAGPSSSSSG